MPQFEENLVGVKKGDKKNLLSHFQRLSCENIKRKKSLLQSMYMVKQKIYQS